MVSVRLLPGHFVAPVRLWLLSIHGQGPFMDPVCLWPWSVYGPVHLLPGPFVTLFVNGPGPFMVQIRFL